MLVATFVDFFAFQYKPDPDSDGAEIALRAAGYTVAKVPRRLIWEFTDDPGDDFMYAVSGAITYDDRKVVSAIRDEINAIVRPYGGEVADCRLILSDLPSLDTLFEQRVHGNISPHLQ